MRVYRAEWVFVRKRSTTFQPARFLNHLRPCSMDKRCSYLQDTKCSGQEAPIFIQYSNNSKPVLTEQDGPFLIPTLP